MIDPKDYDLSDEQKLNIVNELHTRYRVGEGLRRSVLWYTFFLEHETKDLLRRVLRIPDDDTDLFGKNHSRALPFHKRLVFLLEICYSRNELLRRSVMERMDILLRIRSQLLGSADTVSLKMCLDAIGVPLDDFRKYKIVEKKVVESKTIVEGEVVTVPKDFVKLTDEEKELREVLVDIGDYLIHGAFDMQGIIIGRYFVEGAEQRIREFVEQHANLSQMIAEAYRIQLMGTLPNKPPHAPFIIERIPAEYAARVRFMMSRFIMQTQLSLDQIYDLIQSHGMTTEGRAKKEEEALKKAQAEESRKATKERQRIKDEKRKEQEERQNKKKKPGKPG